MSQKKDTHPAVACVGCLVIVAGFGAGFYFCGATVFSRIPGGSEPRKLAVAREPAPASSISRENYHKITHLMHYNQVREILGSNGREVSRAGSLVVIVWDSGDSPRCVISVTFDGGFVEAKSIAGD